MNGRFTASGTNEVMVSAVTILMTVAFCGVFVWQATIGASALASGKPIVDGIMFERVFIFILGVAFGKATSEKGVDKGATAALAPPPPAGTTTTTTVTKETP